MSLLDKKALKVERYFWNRANALIAGQVQTVSKHPDRFVEGYPKFLKSASGCMVEDLGGNVYTDFICALGPIILGYADPNVNRKVKEVIDKGSLMSLSSTHESGLARALKYHIPSAEKSRFFKNGSDATTAAVKVARSYTGKSRVIVCGYHGWHDWYSVVQDNKLGIPAFNSDLVSKFKYNDIKSLRDQMDGTVAAVIMEPIQFEEPKNGFLEEVRELCFQHNAMLIFDEVITGFRFHLGGAQALTGVTPDLSTFSKAMGNGFPISAVVGKSKIMDEFERQGFFCSGTFGGDLIGIVAAKEVFNQLERNENAKLKAIWKSGADLREGFNYLADSLKVLASCEGYAPRTRFNFPSVAHKGVFYQQMCKKQVLLGPTNFINASHSPMIIQTVLQRIESVLASMKPNWDNIEIMLEGPKPQEVILR